MIENLPLYIPDGLALKHYFLVFLFLIQFLLLAFFSLFNLFLVFFMFSYQFPFAFLSSIETNRFLQMHLNLNFLWFIFNLKNFPLFTKTRFPFVLNALLQLCKLNYTVSTPKAGPSGCRGFPRGGGDQALCQQGRSGSKADTVDYPLPVWDFYQTFLVIYILPHSPISRSLIYYPETLFLIPVRVQAYDCLALRRFDFLRRTNINNTLEVSFLNSSVKNWLFDVQSSTLFFALS